MDAALRNQHWEGLLAVRRFVAAAARFCGRGFAPGSTVTPIRPKPERARPKGGDRPHDIHDPHPLSAAE
jgi:hypothetical protein